jgi:SAM-dependent methyltransferase
MKIIDYRFITTKDNANSEFNSWSRVYEYQYCLDFINSNGMGDVTIHNSAWGTDDKTKWASCADHVLFREKLDKLGECIHSDLEESLKLETYKYDITKDHPEFNGKFDYVVNISVIEHLPIEKQFEVIKNLLNQVKEGGHLICTFDFPRVPIKLLTEFLGVEILDNGERLCGSNSIKPNNRYEKLNVIGLIIKK